MDEAVDDGDRHCLVREDLAPFAEWLVGGDQEGSPLVAGADELKEHAGFGLVFGDVGEVIQDQEVEFVELGNGGFESELAAGNLQPLDKIGGAGEQHAPAPFDEREAESCRKMALAAARRPEEQQIGAVVEPGVTGGERHYLGFADHRDGLKVKGVEGLAWRQPGFSEVAFEPAPAAFGNLMFGQCCQEASCRPAFLVGLGGKGSPDQFYRGQPQLGEKQLDTGSVARVGRSHAAPTSWTVLSSS